MGHERIYHSNLKLPGGHALFEKNGKFSVSPTLWFWKTKISPDKTKEARPSPEKSCLRTPIPSGWIQHSWGDDIANNAGDIEQIPCQHNSLGAESSGAQLRNK